MIGTSERRRSARHVAPVLVGQGQVEQHHVGLERRRELDRFAAGPRHAGPEPHATERPRERLGDRLFVLDEQDERTPLLGYGCLT